MSACKIDECGKPARSRGWCSAHYERWRKRNTSTPPPVRQPCSIDGCEKLETARGWCGMHWWRWRYNGDPLALQPAKSPAEKILVRVAKDPATGCWNWTAYIDAGGYGRSNMPGLPELAHRASYEAFVGPIPNGLTLDHLCQNTRCVNPDHLEPVTNAENVRRANQAKTHCKRGHEFNEANTTVHPVRGRRCLVCHRDDEGARAKQKREERV